jgi:hypothetical protein
MSNLPGEIARVAGGARLRLRRVYPSDIEDAWQPLPAFADYYPAKLDQWRSAAAH